MEGITFRSEVVRWGSSRKKEAHVCSDGIGDGPIEETGVRVPSCQTSPAEHAREFEAHARQVGMRMRCYWRAQGVRQIDVVARERARAQNGGRFV